MGCNSQPGIKPSLPELGMQSLSHWTAREVPPSGFLTSVECWLWGSRVLDPVGGPNAGKVWPRVASRSVRSERKVAGSSGEPSVYVE